MFQRTAHVESNELLRRFKEMQIDLGKNPKRTLTYWRTFGLIPSPIIVMEMGRKGAKSYYPPGTLELITFITQRQKEGVKLADILQEIKTNPSQAMDSKGDREYVEQVFEEYGIDRDMATYMQIRDLAFKMKQEITRLKEEIQRLKGEPIK